LFAETLKGKPRTPATLRDVGGVAGVGVTFLEETLGERTPNPTRRLYAKACRTVLAALLPEAGMDIKGTIRDQASLAAAAGLERQPRELDEVLRILDGELRLITPTDAAGSVGGYQLTHDYLVPSLREWLTRKERETKRGRAMLLLRERAALWHAKPQDRFLPSLAEFLTVRRHTRRQDWSRGQAQLMKRAQRVHLRQAAKLGLLLFATTAIGLYGYGSIRAKALVRNIVTAATPDVPALVAEVSPFHFWADAALRRMVADPQVAHKSVMHSRLALLPVDSSQAKPLTEAMLSAAPQDLRVIAEALHLERDQVAPDLWSRLETANTTRDVRLRAAAALALLDPTNARWNQLGKVVATDLVRESPLSLGPWVAMFRPDRAALLPDLVKVSRAKDLTNERALAFDLVAQYAADRPDLLVELWLTAQNERQVTSVGLDAHREVAQQALKP
jgi:hypothetical protein